MHAEDSGESRAGHSETSHETKRGDPDSGPKDGGGRSRGARKSKVKEPVTNPPSNRLTRKSRIASGRGESGAVEKQRPLPKHPTTSQTLHAHENVPSYYDRKRHVSAWVDRVIAAGPLAVC